MRDAKCKDKVQPSFDSTIEDLDQLWKAYCNGDDEIEDLGTFCEYGLCFDYVAAGTFTDQDSGYFRYQLSYGGPSTEFRFYTDAALRLSKIEYWYLDWFDGAHINVTSNETMKEIFGFFSDIGALEIELEKATT